MAEVMYKAKKIDVKIQKREQELRKELAEKSENEANRFHVRSAGAKKRATGIKQAEAKERWEKTKLQTLQFEIQLTDEKFSKLISYIFNIFFPRTNSLVCSFFSNFFFSCS